MSASNENKFDDAIAYERYVGRWSREVAKEFINWLALPAEQVWLDLGSGTGILSDVILQRAHPKQLIGVDSSQVYVELAQKQINDPRAHFQTGDANDLNLNTSFDVAVAGLLLNFVPSPQKAVHNMADLVKPQGLVAAYVWDYAGKMEMMRHFWDAAIAVDPSASELDAGKNFEICHPDNLKKCFEDEGLQSVEVTELDIIAIFQDLEDYWQPFLAAQGSVSKYLRSLNEEMRQSIYSQLKTQLPFEADGTIHLIMRAWAVKGRTLAS